MEVIRNNTVIEVVQGDIAAQEDVEAIVNAANAELKSGGGVAGAIYKAAGPSLEREAVPKGPIEAGQAIITEAGELENEHVIHCLGPVYGSDEPADRLLAHCYKNALSLANEEKVTSIAFPAISTGAFGYPLEDAADVAMKAVVEATSSLQNVRLVRFVLYSKKDFDTFVHALDRHAHT
jgi:O-acetyl-ADP-ribose deacetylase (regulator of RNase III)